MVFNTGDLLCLIFFFLIILIGILLPDKKRRYITPKNEMIKEVDSYDSEKMSEV